MEALSQVAVEFAEKLYRNRVPYSGSLELTYHCNLRCRHCYQFAPRGQELDLKAWRRILCELSESGCLYIAFTGGEPTLRPDLPDLLALAAEQDFVVTLQTNAVRIGKALIGILRDLPNTRVDVSVYGSRPGTHDRFTGVDGSYAAMRGSLDRLLEAGVPVMLKMTVGSFNLGEMEEVMNLAQSMGVEAVFSSLIFPRNDGDPGPLKWRLGDRELEEFYRLECERQASRLGNRLFKEGDILPDDSPPLEGCLVGLPSLPGAGRRHCGCGSTVFAVNPYGEVYPCVAFPLVIGNVKEESFSSVWKNSLMLREIRDTDERLPRECGNCPELDLCPICRALSYLEDGALLARNRERCRQTRIFAGVLKRGKAGEEEKIR
ncbi:MAG: radical SAM/SPASM domain-containing protein [Actinomycetota bacterium]